MRSFDEIYATASLHKGGSSALEATLPKPKTSRKLNNLSDDRYLSEMSRRVFRAGLKHEMVDKKWPDFEDVFHRFDPDYCSMISDEQIEQFMGNSRIIRHLGKVKSIRENAYFVREMKELHGGFGRFLTQWPEDDLVGLWLTLKKKGKQLGGVSGPYFLRMVGKDTFLLTQDVVAVLIQEKVIDKAPSSQKALYAAQDAFMTWKEQSARPLCEISRIVSCSVG